jgi:hypothetical protein
MDVVERYKSIADRSACAFAFAYSYRSASAAWHPTRQQCDCGNKAPAMIRVAGRQAPLEKEKRSENLSQKERCDRAEN